MNPLFNQMQGNGNNVNMFMQRIQQLKQHMGGDPNQHIQQLLNSGKVSQAQYNQAIQQAKQLRSIFGK